MTESIHYARLILSNFQKLNSMRRTIDDLDSAVNSLEKQLKETQVELLGMINIMAKEQCPSSETNNGVKLAEMVADWLLRDKRSLDLAASAAQVSLDALKRYVTRVLRTVQEGNYAYPCSREVNASNFDQVDWLHLAGLIQDVTGN